MKEGQAGVLPLVESAPVAHDMTGVVVSHGDHTAVLHTRDRVRQVRMLDGKNVCK